MSSIGKLMKQAGRLQRQMEAVQQGLANKTVEATSGGGAVRVVAKCDGTIAAIKIDPQAATPADISLLEVLVLTSVNSALAMAKDAASEEMGRVTGGLNIPGMV